ncbi:MAG: metal-dependent hydrolase [Bacteroidia bacterium]
MPSAFTHAFAAISFGRFFSAKQLVKLFLLGAICAALPDIDAIGFHMGIPYGSTFGHRGFTHSIFFSVVLAIIVMRVFYSKEKKAGPKAALFFYFFLSTLSHPLLDMLTNGGLGVALFSPFSNQRYFFPFHPVRVSPISVGGFFTQRGLEVFKSEFYWIWLPSFVVLFFSMIFTKRKSS